MSKPIVLAAVMAVACSLCSLCSLCSVWSAPPGSTVKLSEVASAADLTAELESLVSQIEAVVVSPESFQAATNRLRQAALQMSILAQALAEHDEDSKLRQRAPSVRDAGMRLAANGSYDQARDGIKSLHLALDGKAPVESKVSFDWAALARTRLLMESLRERTDLVRKAIRRSKNPVVESRHATTMAVLMLAVAAHSDDVKLEADRPAWRAWSLDCQKELTQTAAALKNQDATAILEHFTAAQVCCDKCHDKFKK